MIEKLSEATATDIKILAITVDKTAQKQLLLHHIVNIQWR